MHAQKIKENLSSLRASFNPNSPNEDSEELIDRVAKKYSLDSRTFYDKLDWWSKAL